MAQSELVNLPLLSSSFPTLEGLQVSRDNLLDALERALSTELEVLIVEGEEGVGKTNLLAQFVLKHPDTAISIFLPSSSRWSLDIGRIRLDLCNQIYWSVFKEEIRDLDKAMESHLRSYIYSLQKLAQRESLVFYFILDGLDQISHEEWRSVSAVLELLPLGLPRFRFLISGPLAKIQSTLPRGVRAKSFIVPGFTLDEADQLFSDYRLGRDDLRVLVKVCSRLPSRLLDVKRVMRDKRIELRQLLEEIPDQVTHIFELEWSHVDHNDETLSLFLSLLAYDDLPLTAERASSLLGVSTDDLKALASRISFIDINQKNGEFSYVSPHFRNFASRNLVRWKNHVQAIVADALLSHPDDDAALVHLPDHLLHAGRREDLLQFLDNERLIKMIERAQSNLAVRQKIGLAVRAARELGRDGDLLRLSMALSTLLTFEGVKMWSSELEAYLAFYDYASAVNLAQAMFSKEDRLHALAVIAKHQKQKSTDPALISQIRQLFGQIDAASLGHRAIEIAAALLPVLPDFAFELLESSIDLKEGENSLEFALAALSAMAIEESERPIEAKRAVDVIRTRSRNPELQTFYAGMSALVGESQADMVISEVGFFGRAGDKLYVLRRWCVSNKKNVGAGKVIGYALDLLIKSTDYSPTPRVFCDLAAPLPYLKDEDEIRRLVKIFEAQRGALGKIGPSEDAMELQLRLAAAEKRYSVDATVARLVEAFFEIQGMSAVTVKIGSLARLVATLKAIDRDEAIERQEGLLSLSYSTLRECLSDLLNGSAFQYETINGVLAVLAPADIDLALDVALDLNTEPRRDEALATVIAECLDEHEQAPDYAKLLIAIGKIADYELRDQSIVSLLQALKRDIKADRREASLSEFIIFSGLNLIDKILDAEMRCLACCCALEIISGDLGVDAETTSSKYIHELSLSWATIDEGWEKVDVGFKIARKLAEVHPDEATKYLSNAREIRSRMTLGSEASDAVYGAAIRLAIRSLAGLLPRGLMKEEDLGILGDLIERVPSLAGRARLWSWVAILMHLYGRSTKTKELVRQQIRPLLRLIEDKANYWACLADVAVALYCAHPPTAFQDILDLPLQWRDYCLRRIEEFIAMRQLPGDPYEKHPTQSFDLSYEECVDICGIAEKCDADLLTFALISDVSEAASTKRGRQRFSQQQIADLCRRFGEIAEKKLPNERYIKHNGYVLAVRAETLKVKRGSLAQWESLLVEVEDIPNSADRIFLKILVCEYLIRTRDGFDRAIKLLESLEISIKLLPSLVDRVVFFQRLAKTMAGIDAPKARHFLKEAWKAGLDDEDSEGLMRLLGIVDFAYSLDPDLAASLATLGDDDPNRALERSLIRKRIEGLDRGGRLLKSGMKEGFDVDSGLPKDIPRLWGLLNARRGLVLDIKRSREVLEVASRYSLVEAEAAFSWIMQNLVMKYSETDDAVSYFRPLFDASVGCAQMIERLGALLDKRVRVPPSRISSNNTGISVLVRAGEKDKAVRFIREWLLDGAKEVVKICDPYFGPWELSAVMLILEVRPDCCIEILTSRKHQEASRIRPPWADSYRAYWRVLSAVDPPDTNVVIVGVDKTGKSPIHDRWWLTRGSGIRMGTSYSSLGVEREAELGYLSLEEAQDREREIDGFLTRTVRYVAGEKLVYESFTL